FANDQSAAERGEHHGNGEKHYVDAGRGWRRRVVERYVQVTIGRNEVPPTAVPGVRWLRQTVRIDLRRFRYRRCHSALKIPFRVLLVAPAPKGASDIAALYGIAEAIP